MRGFADSSIPHYAVIEARRAEGPSERFVFSYSNEKSLRDLIAGPSIIASGFDSRDEAQANIGNGVATTSWKVIQRSSAQGGTEKRQLRVLSAKLPLGASFDVTHQAKLLRGVIETAAAAAAFIFYSRNTVFSLLRSFLGA